MAIQREFFSERADGVKLFRTFSDTGKYIVKGESGDILEDAVDVENTAFTYTESEESIPEHLIQETNK